MLGAAIHCHETRIADETTVNELPHICKTTMIIIFMAVSITRLMKLLHQSLFFETSLLVKMLLNGICML
jgi:hypothetical protein